MIIRCPLPRWVGLHVANAVYTCKGGADQVYRSYLACLDNGEVRDDVCIEIKKVHICIT